MMNFKQRRRLIQIVSIILIGAGIFFIVKSRLSNQSAQTSQAALPQVELINLADYAKANHRLKLTGQLEAAEQIELRSQLAAVIKAVNVSIGDYVVPGQILVEFENTEIKAQLDQAQAGLSAEKALLAQVEKGARPEEIALKELQLSTAQQNLTDSYLNAAALFKQFYDQADQAIRANLTSVFINPMNNNYQLTYVTCAGQAEVDACWNRQVAEAQLKAFQKSLIQLEEPIDINLVQTILDQAKKDLNLYQSLLDQVNETLTIGCTINDSSLDGSRTMVNASQAILNGLVISLNTTEQGLTNQKSNVQRITDELVLLKKGATNEQLEAQKARVQLAEAAVSLVSAQFDKTMIKAPIFGYVSLRSVKTGDLLSPGQLVITVVNLSGLKIKTFIDAVDFKKVYPEDKVIIDNTYQGIVSRLSPSLDPQTKKVELEILVTDQDTDLLVGQYVNLEILTQEQSTADVYVIPLSSIQVSSDASYVYTLNDKKEIEAHLVELGTIIGDGVEIKSGLEPTWQLVKAVRGLKVGQVVQD